MAALLHGDGAAQQFRHREHADQRRDEVDARQQIDIAEGEARLPCGGIDADAADGEPDEQRQQALERVARADEHRAGEAEAGQPEIFEGREVDRDLGQRRRQHDQDDDAENAAEHGEDEVDAHAQVELALLGHLVALIRIGGRGRRARHAQHRGGNIAGEDRHGGGGDDGAQRRHRRHEEGDRHQQRRRHRRGQAGHGADEHAEHRRAHDHGQDVRVEDEPEGGGDRGHRGLLRARCRGCRAAGARASDCRRSTAPRWSCRPRR